MKNNYFMLDYIHEIPAVLDLTLNQNEGAIREIVSKAEENQINKIVIIGLGSSYTAALMAEPVFRQYCRLPVYIMASTELPPFIPGFIDSKTLVIAVSRSGERNWLVDVFKDSIQAGAMGIAITGVNDSLLAQNAQFILITREGPEITFAKTKSVSTSCGLLMRIALAFASQNDPDVTKQLSILQASSRLLEETIRVVEPQVQALMPELLKINHVMIGGTIGNFGAAMEFAIKLPEAASIPVISNNTGNMLHGPWFEMDKSWIVMLLVTHYDLDLSRTTMGLATGLKSQRMVITEPDLDVTSFSDYKITLPRSVDLLTTGLVYLIPLQLLTYYWSIGKGLNPDEPAEMRDMLKAMLPPGREEPELRNFDKK